MNRRRLISIMAASVALVLACCMDDHVLEQAETIYRGETPVGVKVAFTDEGWISDEAETRAGNNLNGGTFSLGTNSNTNSAVALCVDNGSGTYSSFKYGVTANSTTLTAPETPPYFPIGVATIHAYARYPYVSSIGWNGTTFSVNADQSTDANYCMSDLMLTDGLTQTRTLNTSTGISWNNTSVTLPFKHKLSKISMSIVIPNDITVTKVELLNVNRTINLTSSTSNNVVTNNVGTTLTNSGAVTVYSNSTGAKNTTLNVAAIIPPQAVSNKNFIRITESGGNTVTYKLASKTFNSGYAYTVKVTLTKTQLGQTFNIPAWSDQSLTVTINIAQNNQITLGTHTQSVTVSSGGSVTTSNIAVNNSKGTLSWDATSSTVTGITPNISSKNISFTITSAVPVGTYTYILRDTPASGSEYSQSTAAITIRVGGVSGGTNTGDSSAIISVTLYIPATYTAPTAKTGLTYSGSAQQLVNAGTASGGTLCYKIDSGSWTTSVSDVKATNAKDSYTVYYYVIGDSSHSDVGSPSSPAGSVSVKIAKATPSVTAPKAKTLTYTGSAQALVNAGSTTAGTLQYSLTSGSGFSNSVPSQTNAGSYTVYYKVVGNTNYNDVGERSVSVSIRKAAGTLSLSNTSMTLKRGGTGTSTITTNSTGAKTATSSNTAVATVAVSGNTVTVTGVGGGTATITVSVAGDSNHNAPSNKTISVTIGTYFGSHEAVQLWDGGPYWATTNIGASTETEYGYYYAWGETTTKSDYSGTTYTYSGNPDTLDSDHDAATQNWGDDWRMPTKAEFEDLLSKTTRTWETNFNGSGKNGYKFTNKGDSSKYIFLPAAGDYYGTSLYDAGTFGLYWSSSIDSSDTGHAWNLYFNSFGAGTSSYHRYFGRTVRPVHD